MSSGEKRAVPQEAGEWKVPQEAGEWKVPQEAGKWNIVCPDCGCDLTLDAATGEVLYHRPAKRQPAEGQDFDQLLAGLDDSKQRAEEVFQREVTALKDRDRLMEEKFREAVRRAEEEPDQEPPPRPWDLD